MGMNTKNLNDIWELIHRAGILSAGSWTGTATELYQELLKRLEHGDRIFLPASAEWIGQRLEGCRTRLGAEFCDYKRTHKSRWWILKSDRSINNMDTNKKQLNSQLRPVSAVAATYGIGRNWAYSRIKAGLVQFYSVGNKLYIESASIPALVEAWNRHSNPEPAIGSQAKATTSDSNPIEEIRAELNDLSKKLERLISALGGLPE